MGSVKWMIIRAALFCWLIYGLGGSTALADDQETTPVPTRYGVAASMGNTIDPVTDIAFVQLSGFVMWDYDRVWRHWAPEALRFKIEAYGGTTLTPNRRVMASVGMAALFFIEPLTTRHLRPYLEGGIGGIYTDFKVEGQGSRINFNPQIGIGGEFGGEDTHPYFAALRLSHISNAGVKQENRGVNALVLMIGRYF